MIEFWEKWRQNEYLLWFVINLRFLIGFGFIPSGFKKIYAIPFANPGQEGAFFEYLDALYATGFYYEFIGWAQVIAAALLISQRFAFLGAFMFFPIILNIMVFTHSTIGSLTPWIATCMFLGIVFLLIWDLPRWIAIFSPQKVNEFKLNMQDSKLFASKSWVWVGMIILVVPFILRAVYLINPLLDPHLAFIGLFALTFAIVFIANLIHAFRLFKNKPRKI